MKFNVWRVCLGETTQSVEIEAEAALRAAELGAERMLDLEDERIRSVRGGDYLPRSSVVDVWVRDEAGLPSHFVVDVTVVLVCTATFVPTSAGDWGARSEEGGA